MGLDISVYKNLKLVALKDEYEGEYDDIDICVFVLDPDWEDRIKNFKQGFYEAEFIHQGPTTAYSRHGVFRRQLCAVSNVQIEDVWEGKHNDIPFYEIIDFADNEGALDYEVAEKLYNDFINNREKFSELEDGFMNKYDEWTETCKVAADNKGVIIFS